MFQLHVGTQSSLSVPMLGAIAVAVAGSGVLLGLGLAALLRRRSWSYLLVAGALAALFARAGVAALSVAAVFGPVEHHVIEHGLDAVMVALVVGAVLNARSIRRGIDRERRDPDRGHRKRSGHGPDDAKTANREVDRTGDPGGDAS